MLGQQKKGRAELARFFANGKDRRAERRILTLIEKFSRHETCSRVPLES